MKYDVCNLIGALVEYAVERELIDPLDRVFYRNRLMEELQVSAFESVGELPKLSLEELLGALCDYAVENEIIPDCGVTGRDLFDTRLMGLLTPRPSEVVKKFRALYAESPERATDYYYRLSCDSDYIRTYRIKRDLKWIYRGKYGDLDITVNLSKPEKDPRDIAAQRNMAQTGYPKCMLCVENPGYAGRIQESMCLVPALKPRLCVFG